MNILYRDYETRSLCDLKTCGVDVYARHPSTEVLCVAWAINDEPVKIVPIGECYPLWFANWCFYEESFKTVDIIVGHNISFELALETHKLTYEARNTPFLLPKMHHDTMAMAYAMSLPPSLEECAKVLGVSQQKDKKGAAIMSKLSKPKSKKDLSFWTPEEKPEEFEKLYEYCKQDVETTRAIYKKMAKLSSEEIDTFNLDREINNRGVQVDVKSVKAAIELLNAEKRRLDREMQVVTDGNVTSFASSLQLIKWLRSQGVETESVDKGHLNVLLETDLTEKCRKAILIRQEAAKSSTAKLKRMLDMAGPDGRIRGLFQYHGASTGRWAGRGVQLQNLPRSHLNNEQIEEVFEVLND